MIAENTLLQNRYLVVRLIAHGGMGAVYLARDQRLHSDIALKETFFFDNRLLFIETRIETGFNKRMQWRPLSSLI